jgi:hypothetical protein
MLINNIKNKKTLDVDINDIDIISNDMTKCIKNSSLKNIQKNITKYPDEIDLYINESTPNITPKNDKKKMQNILSMGDEYECIDNDTVLEEILVKNESICNEELKSIKELKNRINKRKSSFIHETSDTHDRKELLWTTNIENVIKGWHNTCLKYANIHETKSKYHKKVFYILGIPAAIIPMALASASDILGDYWKIVTICSLILTGILNIIMGFKNPGQRAESHLNFSALYSELSVEITSELVKPQAYRSDADVFIQKIMDRFNSLNNRAPQM